MFGRCSPVRASTALSRSGSAVRAAPALRTPLRCGFASLDTDERKSYYCLGVNVGHQLDNGTLTGATPADVEAIAAGLADALNGAEMQLDVQEFSQTAAAFFAAKAEAAAAEANKGQLAFLEAAAAEDSATQTESGLVIKEAIAGEGDSPTAADTVEVHAMLPSHTIPFAFSPAQNLSGPFCCLQMDRLGGATQVHYEGRLIDGTVFDSSIQRGETVSFPLNGVIGARFYKLL